MPLFPMNVASGLVQLAATVSACTILGRIAAESARPQRRAVSTALTERYVAAVTFIDQNSCKGSQLSPNGEIKIEGFSANKY